MKPKDAWKLAIMVSLGTSLISACTGDTSAQLDNSQDAIVSTSEQPTTSKPTSASGTDWGVEASEFRLTSTSYNDHMIHHTRDSWSYQKHWIIFISDRDGDWDIYALKTADNRIFQLTNEPDLFTTADGGEGHPTTEIVLSGNRNILYYIRSDQSTYVKVVELNFGQLLFHAQTGHLGPKEQYNRMIKEWTSGNIKAIGGLSLDAGESHLYLGLETGNTTSTITRVKIADGSENNVHVSHNYAIGEIQANPWVSNELIFQYESRQKGQPFDDIPPQKIHFVKGDGTVYQQIYNYSDEPEIVGEATWAYPDTIAFHITSGSRDRRGLWHVSKDNRKARRIASFDGQDEDEYVRHARVWGTDNYVLDVAQVVDCNPCTLKSKQWYFLDLLSGENVLLASGQAGNITPRVHPDKQQLLFEHRLGGSNLYVINF